MAFILALVVLGWASWASFAIGRATADRWVSANHHKLAMFTVALRERDDLIPFLSTDQRRQMDALVDEYTAVRMRSEFESDDRLTN